MTYGYEVRLLWPGRYVVDGLIRVCASFCPSRAGKFWADSGLVLIRYCAVAVHFQPERCGSWCVSVASLRVLSYIV